MTTKIHPAIKSAYRQQAQAMIGNLFWGPVEAIAVSATAKTISFQRKDTGKIVSFSRADIGESVFVQYFTA